MNFKNQRRRYWLTGLAVLLAGIFVFCLLHFSYELAAIPSIAAEDLPKIQAAVRHACLRKIVGPLITLRWQKLPRLLADWLGRPIVGGMAFKNDYILVVTINKKAGTEGGYYLEKSETGWKVVAEVSPVPLSSARLMPLINANQGK
jgi:hypothetical protein